MEDIESTAPAELLAAVGGAVAVEFPLKLKPRKLEPSVEAPKKNSSGSASCRQIVISA